MGESVTLERPDVLTDLGQETLRRLLLEQPPRGNPVQRHLDGVFLTPSGAAPSDPAQPREIPVSLAPTAT